MNTYKLYFVDSVFIQSPFSLPFRCVVYCETTIQSNGLELIKALCNFQSKQRIFSGKRMKFFGNKC